MATLDHSELTRRLERALKVAGNTHTADDIMDAVSEGRMQAWVKNDSLVVSEIMTFPQKCVVNIVLAVGLLDDVMSLQKQIREFGREYGADRMRMEGRAGWSDVLPKHGWRRVPHVIYEMEL